MVLDSKKRPQGTFDSNLELDSGHQVNTATTTYGSDSDDAAIVLDIGTGLFKGMAIIDVSAIDTAAGNENYDFYLQGGEDDQFAAAVPLVTLKIGDVSEHALRVGADSTAGRYKMYFDNESNGTYYRYVRLALVTTGDVDITFSSYVVPIN